VEQVQPPNASGFRILVAFTPQGMSRSVLVPAQVGEGVTLDTSTTPPTLRIVVPPVPAPSPKQQPILVRPLSAMTSFTLPADPIGHVTVIRNGIFLALSVDYTVTGREVTFLPGAIPCDGGCASPDVLLFDFVR
jgi:hypothetical protein